MARSRLTLKEHRSSARNRLVYDVFHGSQHVAVVHQQQGHSGVFRFTLDNYPQTHSKMYGTLKTCIAAIEKEVL